ncbi:hypothetical protein BRSU_0227 [Brachyspira suanatina]|uniref:Uncharacterized protein n=1 Tax=Brachyspira suanatina TaxID=381802 RepID=A0A0G4K3R9_9SPIR|nr:hypothetical protein BRSU_0227 [Brachyspira suanatina]
MFLKNIILGLVPVVLSIIAEEVLKTVIKRS